MTKENKPCPVCGTLNSIHSMYSICGTPREYVDCENCYATMPRSTWDGLVKRVDNYVLMPKSLTSEKDIYAKAVEKLSK